MSFRTYFAVDGEDRSLLATQVNLQRARVRQRLQTIERVIAVMSGKGGVGKSYLTAAVALAAAERFKGVGVLDADLRGPTVARLLAVEGPLEVGDDAAQPATGAAGVRVVSSDLLLSEGQPLRWNEPEEDRYVWRGTLEAGVLREFLGDVAWGKLDALFLDLPPGADGVADIAPLVPNLTGAVAVTIPTIESKRSVARAIRATRDAGITVLGVVENMSGYECGSCQANRPLFEGDAGSLLAAEFDIPLLATIPLRPGVPPSAAVGMPVLERLLEAVR